MKVATKLQKCIVSAGVFAVVIGVFYVTEKHISPSMITDKTRETASNYINTQKELESKGYNFTFNFHKGEDKLEKTKVLDRRDNMQTQLKNDSNKFSKVMGTRLQNASYLANEIRDTLANSGIDAGKGLTSSEKETIRKDAKRLNELYKYDITTMEFPDSYSDIKDGLEAKGKFLTNELEYLQENINKLSSDDVLEITRILGNFAEYCNSVIK